jgi:hypothetical protein
MVIDLLSQKGKQLYHFILSGIQQGKSGAEILRALRELGMGYRTQDFYNDLRIIKGETLKWETMKNVRRDAVISPDLYTPSSVAKRNYVTKFLVEVENMYTHEKHQVYVSVLHDAPMKRIELEEIAKDIVSQHVFEYEKYEYWRFSKVMPVQGFRRVST